MASFNKEDTLWLLNTRDRVTETEKSFMYSVFDQQTNYDIELIKKSQIEIKFLKRICLFKILLFIPEYFLYTVFFMKPAIKANKRKETLLYWKFLTNKINFTQFKKTLQLVN